jgi:hypothetical protein
MRLCRVFLRIGFNRLEIFIDSLGKLRPQVHNIGWDEKNLAVFPRQGLFD